VGVCECGFRDGSGGSTSTGASGTGGRPATSSQGGRATASGGRATGVAGRGGGSATGGDNSTADAGETSTGGKSGSADAPDYMKTGTFDPQQVYLLGTLSEGACYLDALTHWATPDFALTGFDCDTSRFGGMFIRPSDGRYVFSVSASSSNDYLAFVPDGSGTEAYPKDPYTNDILLPSVCANPRSYFLDPSGGESVYLCYGSAPCAETATAKCAYYYESEEEYAVPAGNYLVRLGFDGYALLGSRTETTSTESWTVLTPDGELVPASQTFQAAAMRAHPEGFWLLRSSPPGLQRWNLGFDGSVVLDGAYPDPPLTSAYAGGCAFEGGGAVVCMGRSTDVTFEDHILRAELDADEAEVVYTEASDPLVKVHGSSLVTGP
jgi:hypothetical protein